MAAAERVRAAEAGLHAGVQATAAGAAAAWRHAAQVVAAADLLLDAARALEQDAFWSCLPLHMPKSI